MKKNKGTHIAKDAIDAKKMSFRGFLWNITKVELHKKNSGGFIYWFYIERSGHVDIRTFEEDEWVTVSFKK